MLHALWLCPIIQLVWKKEDGTRRMSETLFHNFADLCGHILSEGTSVHAEKFVTLCWALWNRRNKVRLNKPVESLEQINAFAQNYLDEFSQCSSCPMPPQGVCPPVMWRAPTRCHFKINYDAAVFSDSGEAGLGVVVRNASGLPLASLAQRIKFPFSIEAVEALACKRAVIFATEIGIMEGEFEGDSSTIVQALNTRDHSNAAFGNIIEDITVLSSNLSQAHFLHVKRQGNSVAHALAKYARHSAELKVWMEAVPPTIENLLSRDFPS